MMHRKFILLVAALVVAAGGLRAQAPALQVVQSAPPVSVVRANAPESAGSETMLQSLRQQKAINDELLKRQAATLQQLDEIGKAADQLRTFSTRPAS